MEICDKCLNKKKCFDYYWSITMSGKNTFEGKIVCDNFKELNENK